MQALADHGVTAADVSNAKAQLKRRLQQPILATALVPAPVPDGGDDALNATISVAEINATIEFVQRVGGITRAQQLLTLVHQIQRIG